MPRQGPSGWKKNRTKDENGEYHPLSQAALLQIDCDKRADEIYTTSHKNFRPKSAILVPELVGAVFKSGGIINTSKLKRQIMKDRHGPRLQAYIIKKTKWSTAQFLSIDWPAHKRAMRGKTLSQQVTLVKFLHRWRPTLQRLHLLDPSKYPSAMCNICKKVTESQNHIYKCNHPACREIQISALRQI